MYLFIIRIYMYLYENKLEKELNFIVMATQGYFPLLLIQDGHV